MFTVVTNPEFRSLLAATQKYAHACNHSLLTTYHAMHVFSNTGRGAAVLEQLGVNILNMRKDIDLALKKIAPIQDKEQLRLSGEFTSALKKVDRYAAQKRDPQITLDHLMTVLRLKDVHTGELLRKHGAAAPAQITFQDLMQYTAAPEQSGTTQASDESVDIQDFTEDMTQLSGYYDPVACRDKELEIIMDVLLRRTKNNPLIVGQPGVGKTALVEGLSSRLHLNHVPESLQGLQLLRVDLTNLAAGAKFQGDLEERVQALMKNVMANDNGVILFIDEMHQLCMPGFITVANMLKPALARGRIRLIGATTRKEYDLYIAKDPALARRFERVDLEEATPAQAEEMVKKLKPVYEKFHDLRISDEAVAASVALSARYMPRRTLPDKAVDIMDHACAKVIANNGIRVNLSDIQKSVHALTGIPMEALSTSEKEKLLRLESVLDAELLGQQKGIAAVANAIRRNRAGLADASRPWGSFLFLGPTGVGKTALAKILGTFLFDKDEALLRFDMSEYNEKHSTSRLIGAPPGYVGYDQGGLLTDAVKDSPYSVVLLDEVEKAHPDIFNIFLQILDNGRVTDGQGNTVDFRNTVIIMTSNLGASEQLSAPREEGKKLALAVARNRISSELFNRIDDVIVFDRLEKEHMPGIRDLALANTKKQLSERGIALEIDEKVLKFLLKEGFDAEFGARPMRRATQVHIDNKVAMALLGLEDSTSGVTILITMNDKNNSTVGSVIGVEV